MAVSAPLKGIAPYAQQLLYNEDVQDSLRRALGATRDAYKRAQRKGPREAAQDKRFRRRVQQAAEAASEAWSAVSEPPRKPRWGRRLVVLAIGAGGVLLAVNADARATVLDLLGKKDSSSGNSPQ